MLIIYEVETAETEDWKFKKVIILESTRFCIKVYFRIVQNEYYGDDG